MMEKSDNAARTKQRLKESEKGKLSEKSKKKQEKTRKFTLKRICCDM